MVNLVAEKGIPYVGMANMQSFKFDQINEMVHQYHEPDMKGIFVITFS